MALEIQVLAWGRHTNVEGKNLYLFNIGQQREAIQHKNLSSQIFLKVALNTTNPPDMEFNTVQQLSFAFSRKDLLI